MKNDISETAFQLLKPLESPFVVKGAREEGPQSRPIFAQKGSGINARDREKLINQYYQPRNEATASTVASSSTGLRKKSLNTSFLRTSASKASPTSAITPKSLLTGTPKNQSKNVRMMLIDDEESGSIMRNREATKMQEKMDLEREQEEERMRKKAVAEERKLAKIQDAEQRKREREENKKLKMQELEGKQHVACHCLEIF